MLFFLIPQGPGSELYAQNQSAQGQIQTSRPQKTKSNKKQLRTNKRKNRGRKGEKAKSKDIAGRKLRKNTTPRSTYARPQPSPYIDRKNFGRAERPAPEPPPNFRKPPGNDRPKKKDIAGRRIRPRAPSTGSRKVIAASGAGQRSQRKSEQSIAKRAGSYSVRPQSISRPSERARVKAGGPPPSRSGPQQVRKSKNPYKGKARRLQDERGTSKDIAGRKLRTRNAVSPRPRPDRGYSASDTYFGRKPKGDKSRFNKSRMQATPFRSATGAGEAATERTAKGNVPGFKNYRSPQQKAGQKSDFRPYAGRKQRGEGEFFQDTKPKRIRSISAQTRKRNIVSVQVIPKSISQRRREVVRSKSPYKGRYQREGERGSSKDIAGRKLRTKGYVSRKPNWDRAIGQTDPYYGRKYKGDQPAVPISGGFNTSSRGKWNNRGRSIPTKAPLNSAIAANKFQGNMRRGRPVKGAGGSIGRKKWNNQGNAIPARGPSQETSRATQFQGRFSEFQIRPGFRDDYLNYQGNIRSKRPQKGGGSVSRNRWNNNNMAIEGRGPSSTGLRASRYSGNLKARKPLKGGGSVNRGDWNNNNQPIQGRGPSRVGLQASGYSGNLRAKRPIKGAGGTIARNNWNNNNQAIQGRGPSRTGLQASRYSGNLKAKRPIKGAGGTVARNNWNNNNQAIQGRGPSRTGLQASRYTGNLRAKRPEKGGGGSVKRDHWNNNNQPIQGIGPSRSQMQASRYSGNLKSKGKPTVSAEARKSSRFQGRFKNQRVNYFDKTLAIVTFKEYKPRIKPTEGHDYGRTKQLWIIPNRKLNNYGGFVRTEYKANKKEWHPSSKYKDRSATEEKDKILKFRIWWAKLFNRNESQPESVKEKTRRPRYSKDESGIWYE